MTTQSQRLGGNIEQILKSVSAKKLHSAIFLLKYNEEAFSSNLVKQYAGGINSRY